MRASRRGVQLLSSCCWVACSTRHALAPAPLTCAAVGELYSVCQVCGRVDSVPPAPVPVVAHKLGVDIDGRHVVHDAGDLLFGVFQQVAQQRRLA